MTTKNNPNLAKQRYLMLQRAARQSGRPTDEMMAIYVLEAFLARLGKSEHASKLILKGGMLLAAFTQRRVTRDIDLQAIGVASEAEVVGSLVSDVAMILHPDGVAFDTSTMSTEVVREGDDDSGMRVSMGAGLYTAELRLKVDVNVGDPVWPAPIEIEIPSVLADLPTIRLIGYPLPMVLAEKIVTAVSRGVASTRWRDFADIVSLSGSNQINGSELQDALAAVATYREVELLALRDVLAGYHEIAQSRWERWLARQGLSEQISADFRQTLEQVFVLADPALVDQVRESVWLPGEGWTAG
ncbi:MAG: nucleotidyl transferase AbiEii/AbiGii toxin family protein [Actinomycetota bacterium]|nr:nucleotidyl transferase AbiEii/AbiGii toxin family protein [Actinomycetota bacterium]